jgi:peroxiredoxin Q/BCP
VASTAASDSKLAVGDNVSSVNATLLTNEEKEVNLSQICNDQGVVIFTYPKAATSGCTVQACGFRDNYDLIREAGYEVYGLSFDPPQSQTDWKIKENLQYLLLTDNDGTAIKAFGAFKEPQNVVRSHFVIEKGGKILLLENGVKSGESFGQVVEFINTLKK